MKMLDFSNNSLTGAHSSRRTMRCLSEHSPCIVKAGLVCLSKRLRMKVLAMQG